MFTNDGPIAVLSSGGMDSFLLLSMYRDNCVAVSIDYGQTHSAELSFSEIQCAALGINRIVVTVPCAVDSLVTTGDGGPVVQHRNATFCLLALMASGCSDVAIGVTHEDYGDFYDCRREYLDGLEATLGCGLKVHTPLSGMTKVEVANGLLSAGLDPDMSLSCYLGTSCGDCQACKVRNKWRTK